MLTRKTDIRARAIGWKPIFLDDHRWQDRRRRVWNADDKSITPSHANRSQVCTPLFWQAFWYVQVRFFSENLMENLSQPADKGSVASPVSQKFIRIYTSLQEWRQIYWAIVHAVSARFPDFAVQFQKLFWSKQFPILLLSCTFFPFSTRYLRQKNKTYNNI